MVDIISEQTITREEVIALAALAAATGVGIVVLSLQKPAAQQGLPPGSVSLSPPILGSGTVTDAQGGQTQVTFPASGGTITLPMTGTLTINAPQTRYQGSGMNTYTYAQLTQVIGGRRVAVFGSGIAGVFVGPAPSAPALFPLVSQSQPQPNGSTGPYLTLFNWVNQATAGLAICGGPPQAGPATLTVAIYGRCCDTHNPADCANPSGPTVQPCSAQDGFSSPTCNARVPYVVYTWPGTVNLV